MGPENGTDKDYSDLQRSVESPDGRAFEVVVYPGGGGSAGPVFLGADPDAPKAAHAVVRLLNWGLHRLPQKSQMFTFPVVGVLMYTPDDDDDLRQVHTVPAANRTDAAVVVEDLASRIASGRFIPDQDEPPS